MQLVTPAAQEYDAIKESKNQADLTDFDELLNQDLFMALAASSPAEQLDFKMNYSALLQNLIQCENEESPTIRCDDSNIDLVLEIIEFVFYLGGFPNIKVKFTRVTGNNIKKRKRIGNLCSIQQFIRNKMKNQNQYYNLFHFIAMQTQVLADLDHVLELLTSAKSLQRQAGLAQVSSEGLTPIEYALSSKNW